MPKKKLTKTQVKRKVNTMHKALHDLFMDKYGHPDSRVPMTIPKMIEMNKLLGRAFNSVK